MEKRKLGITTIGMTGLVFFILGVVFTSISALVSLNMEAIKNSPNSKGDVTILPWIFGLVGIVFLLLGLVLLAATLYQRKRIRNVIAQGDTVFATVAGVYRNGSININGRNPFYLECHYNNPYDGRIYVFKSKNFFMSPNELIGTEIRVFVDKNRLDRYYVDVESVIGGL